MIYLRLFAEFFKIGLFSVGGGLATIPFLTKLSERSGWFSLEELADMVAVSESTPGPIGVNIATYVGCKLCGVTGGIIATFALVLPSFIIILIISAFLERFYEKPVVQDAFSAIRPASTALISSALYSLCVMSFVSEGLISIKALALGLLLFAVFFFIPKLKKIHPAAVIGIAAVMGIILEL